MSEGIVHADVKFKKHQKTEGKDGATASTGNDATYSEISIPKAGRNQTSTDTDAGDPDSQKGLKVKPGGYDPVKVVLVTLCFLLMGMVIGLRFLFRQQNEELRKQKTPPSCPTNTGNNDGPQPMNCAEGWEYYGGKCYYFSPDKLTWAQSRDECITRGGHLVIIESIEEQIFLDQKTGTKISTDSEDKFWIGLTDSINENEWLWVDNSSLSTSFWLGDQEPDDWKGENPDGEDCARMGEPNGTIDGKSWLDVICNTTQRRICETKSPL
ncbi:C-type lectin domain family 4 member E-like isoform X5 [Oncorhynchus tshawytscha]|uniref:C-type lectin domain family 4 member E-like isoform X5 n=1 Tax=Oncorhynchus tshawytscha TaxID=74940 RepID=UPI001C3DB7AE|nr:C-type lectin domain family 4 member E-like isoform X5 [Oncorhynchus tshawytscha]